MVSITAVLLVYVRLRGYSLKKNPRMATTLAVLLSLLLIYLFFLGAFIPWFPTYKTSTSPDGRHSVIVMEVSQNAYSEYRAYPLYAGLFYKSSYKSGYISQSEGEGILRIAWQGSRALCWVGSENEPLPAGASVIYVDFP